MTLSWSSIALILRSGTVAPTETFQVVPVELKPLWAPLGFKVSNDDHMTTRLEYATAFGHGLTNVPGVGRHVSAPDEVEPVISELQHLEFRGRQRNREGLRLRS